MKRLATPEDTLAWGRELGTGLRAGEVIALRGNLGAGKTQAVKGIAEGLGSAMAVASPTFALVHEYRDGRLPLFHFDFYRLEAADEVLRLGWDDYLDEQGVVVVEWPDRFPELLPEGTRWFELEHVAEGGRLVREGEAPLS